MVRFLLISFLAFTMATEVAAQTATSAPVARNDTIISWSSFPQMALERTYRGPLRDTIVQRWRDPLDGTVCFLYLPISAPLHRPPEDTVYAQYGPNTIGTISCISRLATPPAQATPKSKPTR